MRGRPCLTDEQKVLARALHADGLSHARIADRINRSASAVGRALNPEMEARGLQKAAAQKRKKRAETTLPSLERGQFKPTEAEYRHAISLIPPDTRDLTGRLCGDPLPGDTRRQNLAVGGAS